jgi:hypothetical protein
VNAISGILFFIAYLPYVFSIVNGQTAPSSVSWAIWASIDTLALLAMRKEKATSGQLMGAVAGAWIITVLALVFGESAIGLIEFVSMAGAIAGIIMWQKTGNAVLAIICAQIVVFVGAIPTFVGAYHNPNQEDPIAWIIWFVSCICALCAIKKWNLANVLQPLTFTTIETIMVILVVVRPHLL